MQSHISSKIQIEAHIIYLKKKLLKILFITKKVLGLHYETIKRTTKNGQHL